MIKIKTLDDFLKVSDPEERLGYGKALFEQLSSTGKLFTEDMSLDDLKRWISVEGVQGAYERINIYMEKVKAPYGAREANRMMLEYVETLL